MINVFDNALEPHVAELIDMQLRDVSWKYNYDSVKNGKNKHWHIFCGHNPQECYDNGYGDLIPIWNFIKKHKPQLERAKSSSQRQLPVLIVHHRARFGGGVA